MYESVLTHSHIKGVLVKTVEQTSTDLSTLHVQRNKLTPEGMPMGISLRGCRKLPHWLYS